MPRFQLSGPLNVPASLHNVTYDEIQGVRKREYGAGELIFVSFRTFGGTEVEKNGIVGVENTAIVETWYRPDIKSSSRLVVEGHTYEVWGEPEDIELRHQYLRFKVREIKGGA